MRVYALSITPEMMAKMNEEIRASMKDTIESAKNKQALKFKSKIVKLTDGITSEEELIKIKHLLVKIIMYGYRTRLVREFTRAVLRAYKVEPKNYVDEVAAIHHWVQNNVRYVLDSGEIFQSGPRQLIDWYYKRDGSDCDCKSILFATMLKSIGYDVGINLVDSRGDGVLRHALGMVRLPKPFPPFGDAWFSAELTEKAFKDQNGKLRPILPGWYPPQITVMRQIKILNR